MYLLEPPLVGPGSQGQNFTEANMLITSPFWYIVKVVYGDLTSCPHLI